MIQQDYEQKKHECWDRCVEDVGIIGYIPKLTHDYAFDRAYALGKQEKDAEDDKVLKVSKQLFCRLCADADDYINEHLEEDDSDYGYYQGRSDALHELYRGECKDAEDTVISGWVARDQNGHLFTYCTKPERNEVLLVWIGRCADIDLRDSLFPDLTWESDPEPVEITIKRKKNG